MKPTAASDESPSRARTASSAPGAGGGGARGCGAPGAAPGRRHPAWDERRRKSAMGGDQAVEAGATRAGGGGGAGAGGPGVAIVDAVGASGGVFLQYGLVAGG